MPNATVPPPWFVALTAQHGSPIVAARRHVALDQRVLAEMLGVTQDYLIALERGPYRLTETQAERVAAATGVEAEWLL